ncbi:hypothetical protein M436DRAFT_86402 [Aureobasidium namibiae CBS 147.97]|uniref:PEBP-like protein n=1 Tax=Aureobasidium namibiae CBS 147.97 TaxID=1043004 RepID=A0A074W9U9_9PEZI
MGALNWIEYTLGRLLYNVRGRDSALFTNGPACKDIAPTIRLLAPECGATGSQMLKYDTGLGGDVFPELEWTAPEGVKGFVLVVQNPDILLPFVATHGLFYARPGPVTSIKAADVQYKNEQGSQHELIRPFLLHGPYCYFFQIVALSEPLDPRTLGKRPSLSAISKAINGKASDRASWIGT